MALSAPPEVQAQLLELADIDRGLSRCRAILAALPKTLHIPTLQNALEDIKGGRHEAFIELESIRAELRRAESDVHIVDKRIASDEQRLTQTTSAKDAQALEHELTSLRTRRSHLEDIELAIMETLEAAQAIETDASAALATAEAALGEARATEDTEAAQLRAEIETLTAARIALTQSLPEDLVGLYQRQLERYGAGASHLRGGVSGASGVKLTEADLQGLRHAAPEAVVLCPDSNAILVRTPESGL